jgi:4-amino-4-deoxy-L-arabinose transferase-like glycosyltransferase
VLLLFSLPWLPWLARIVRRDVLTRHDGDGLDSRGPIRWLMLLWIAVVVVFFSLPQSKLLGYVLPAVPPLAVLMADALTASGAPSRRAVRLWWTSAALSAIVSVGAVAAIAIHPLHSSRDVAMALAAQRRPDDAVFMLGNYYFDVPFYARLRDQIGVVDEWNRTDVRDNWRKELADAAAFAPMRAAPRLVTPQGLLSALCTAPISWVIGPATAINDYPILAQARVAFSQRDTTLWRLDRGQPKVASALRCSGTPNDG